MAGKIVYINKGEELDLKAVESGVKNKLNWSWLEETMQVTLPESKGVKATIDIIVGQSIKKIDRPGQAYCQLCPMIINYGNSGILIMFFSIYLI